MIVEDGQGCACIRRGENVEVLPEDLCEGCAGGDLIIDDQDSGFRVGNVRDESGRNTGTLYLYPLYWSMKSQE